MSSKDLLEQFEKLLDEGSTAQQVLEQKKEQKNFTLQKETAQKLFKQFDKDKDGLISIGEFQQLVFELGEVFTLEEIKDAIGQIDNNNVGGISFIDFFQWWSTFTPKGGNQRLDFLRMKLQSESYLRHIREITKKIVETSTEEVPSQSTELDINVTLGNFKHTKSSIKLSAATNPEKAREIVNSAGGMLGDSVAMVVFSVYPSASSSALSDLCTQLNLALTVAKKILHYDKAMVSVIESSDHQRQLLISVVYSGKKQQKITEAIKKLWQNVDLSGTLEFDQSPDDQSPDGELNFRISLKGSVPHGIVANVKHVKKIPEIGRMLNDIFGSEPFQQLIPIVQFGGMDLYLESISEIAKTIFNIDTKEDVPETEHAWYPILDSWNAIRELIATIALKTILRVKEARKHGLSNYFSSMSVVSSLVRLAVAEQHTYMDLNTNNFNFINILPNKESLGFGPTEVIEKVVDDMKLLSFKVANEPSSPKETEKGINLPDEPSVILQNNYLSYAFEREDILVLEYAKPGPFLLNHVIVKSSRVSKNPVRHAFFWAFDEKPNINVEVLQLSLTENGIVKQLEDDHILVQWDPLMVSAGNLIAHVEIGRTTFYGECHLDKPVSGRFIVAAFMDYWECKRSKDKAKVQYVGFVGPAEKPQFKHNLASKFGLH